MTLLWLLRYLVLHTEIEPVLLPRVLFIFITCYCEFGYFCVSCNCLSIISNNKKTAERTAIELQLVLKLNLKWKLKHDLCVQKPVPKR